VGEEGKKKEKKNALGNGNCYLFVVGVATNWARVENPASAG